MRLPFRLLLKELGPRPLAHYLRYQLLLRSGAIRRRTPSYAWSERPLQWWVHQGAVQGPPPVFFLDDRSSTVGDRIRTLQSEASIPAADQADEILRGEFRLFGGEPLALGFPPEWLKLPLGGEAVPTPVEEPKTIHSARSPSTEPRRPGDQVQPLAGNAHWSSYADSAVDFRLLWELSRFGWAYPLARAYWITRQPRYAEGFFELLRSWRESNPPNAGPNWMSGQEAALRIMALSFAWWAFEQLLQGEPEWRELLVATIAVNAARIPPTLAYAQAQRNNHLISEAVGLYTAGLLFPRFRNAARWKSTGRRLLIGALDDQVFSDGGYIQHSTNYHRLALEAGLWMARLAERNREPLPERSVEALRRLTAGLAALLDPESGRAPNLGSNDGSDVLPLGGCAQADYRPAIQAASVAFFGRPALANGAWDETALWLGLDPRPAGGQGRAQAPPAAASARSPMPGQAGGSTDGTRADALGSTGTDFPQAGLYLLRNPTSWAALRCARFSSRPSQSDQLHLDLWWQGHNVARDPGSYRYTVSGLEGAAAHNTLIADGQEPMQRAGQFLWLARHQAEYLGRWRSADGRVETMAAEQPLPGGLLHRRSVVCAADTLWVVIDELAGAGQHATRLAWLLPDWEWELRDDELRLHGGPDQLRLQIDPASSSLALYRAGEQLAGEPAEEPEATVGWWAPSYGRRQPALSLIARVGGPLPLRLASWWRLGEPDLSLELADGPLAQFLGEER